jgi:hypothetical protein
MKKLLFGLLFASSAFASEVRITRFVPVTPDGRLAELCGQVIPAPTHLTVRALVDHGTTLESPYTIMTDYRGKFCHVVATYYGRVLVISNGATKSLTSYVQTEVGSVIPE